MQINDTYGDYWTSFGFGGDYTYQNETELMNGYAVVVDGISPTFVFGTVLEYGKTPVANKFLDEEMTSVSSITVGSVRSTSFKFPYKTLWKYDFSDFSFGEMDIIYAFGSVDGTTLVAHNKSDAGRTTIYVDGHGCFGNESWYSPTPAPTVDIHSQGAGDTSPANRNDKLIFNGMITMLMIALMHCIFQN